MEQLDPKQYDYPTINLGGRELAVKFRFCDIFRLKQEHGIDLLERTELKGAEILERLLRIVAAGISHDAKQALSYDQLAELADIRDIQAIGEAIQQATKTVTQEPKTAKVKPN